jgi:glycosyltransferase involved in cell wall biosynthesis/predicted O-methyltransferase YrrM
MTLPARRICLVAPEFIGPFPNGGVGTACYWEAATLAAAGYDVTVLYTGPTDRETPEFWEATYARGPCAYVDLWRTAAARAAAPAGAAWQPCAEAQTADLVFRYLRDQSFDLLLFQEFLGHGARTLQARRSGEALADTPAAVTLHSCRQWIYEGMKRLPSSRQDLYVDFLERESARLADYVIAPSRHMAEWADRHWALDTPPAVIPYCYDQAIERPAERIRHAGPFTQLVFFGRLETRKGLHVFCRALAREAARGPVTKVTFLGKASVVEGRPSEEFIRATLGQLPGLDIEIISDLGSLEALAWLERQRQTLVVAPSLVDNLPYAVIELFARRLPLLSSGIGGIPEIVGACNAHVLAQTEPDSLAGVLERTHRDGHLTIDYRGGYSIGAANTAHLNYVRGMIAGFRKPARGVIDTCDIVVVDAADARLAAVRERLVAADATAARATFHTWESWLRDGAGRAAIFLSTEVTPRDGMTARLLRALGDQRVAAATGYYETKSAAGSLDVAPLGGSLESGWSHNVFGGPCFAAGATAFDLLREAAVGGFQFWPAYAALACGNLELAIVPDVLFSSQTAADESHEATEAVASQYRHHAPQRLDLGWLIKYAGPAERARSGGAPATEQASSNAGRALYDHFLAIPDTQIQLYSGLTWTAAEDPFVSEMKALRQRLAAVAARWRGTDPRVYMYGAGQHARLVLALEPELGRFIAGFIDRRPLGEFLGKPCLHPEQVTAAIADVVLYSSREYEREMHARLAHLPVEHVLLYAENPPHDAETTAARMRRRLGHTGADVDGLRALLTRRPAWVQGGISGGDSEFLLELVAGVAPRTVLELGVASGASSAALLFALDQTANGSGVLHSCDVRPTCYFDATRATGAAVDDMYPQRRTRWLLDTNTDARRIAETLAAGSIDLTFIDANHSHPWPLLDLLHLTRVARAGSWVALHDIELPRLHPKYQVHGPQWLFEAWPFNKIHGVEGSTNIGAVQLPENLQDLVPMSLALLQRPWEHSPTSWHVALPDVFSEVSRALAPRLPDPARAA